MPTHSTDWFVADDLNKDFMNITQHTCGMHWKIRQFYHEIVQLTGIEYNQCRIARFQRNLIILAALVRIRPIGQARKPDKPLLASTAHCWMTAYCQQLKNPSAKIRFA